MDGDKECSPPPPKKMALDKSISPEKEKKSSSLNTSATSSNNAKILSIGESGDSSEQNGAKPEQNGAKSEQNGVKSEQNGAICELSDSKSEQSGTTPVSKKSEPNSAKSDMTSSKDDNTPSISNTNRILPTPRPQSSARPTPRVVPSSTSPQRPTVSPTPSQSSTSFSPLKCKHNKFVPREDLVRQIMDMGICRNGATKALYWTGNKSSVAASNWIFDQPERDLDTPLEDELEMIRAQQAEREREEREKEENRRVQRMRMHNHHHHHHHHHLHMDESMDSEDMDELHDDDELEDEDEDEEDEDDEDDEDIDMEYKMVFVVNRTLELSPGTMTTYVSKATAGLFRKINGQAQSVSLGPDELGMWGDLGERTVILYADTEQHIKDLELMARSLQLPSYMLEMRGDGGRTGDGGRIGGKAVLGIFGDEREVNKVTGRLKMVP